MSPADAEREVPPAPGRRPTGEAPDAQADAAADWWSRGAGAVSEGLSSYQERTNGELERGYDELAELARLRDPLHLTADEVGSIVAFKTWPGIRSWARSRVSPTDVVCELTTQAFAEARSGHPKAALRTLQSIKQVGVPTASAILAAAMPERFGIIDRYVMCEIGIVAAARLRDGTPPDPALALLTQSLALWAGNRWADAYELYCDGLQMRAEELALADVRTFEKVLYGFALKRRADPA